MDNNCRQFKTRQIGIAHLKGTVNGQLAVPFLPE